MRIAVYGGTGMIGSRVVAEAASRGHAVTALSRRPAEAAEGVRAVAADAADSASASKVAAEHDVVVAAMAPSREPDSDLSAFARMIGALADATAPTRLVLVGGAGSLLLDGVRRVDTPEFPEVYKRESLATAAALDALVERGERVDWTCLCPAPVIAPGERTGEYRTGGDEAAGMSISAEDFAVALVDEIEQPAHRGRRFTVAN